MTKQFLMIAAMILTMGLAPSAFAQFSSTSTDLSSTTSGSVKRVFVQNDKERLQHFVDHNFDRLQQSAVRGSGVALNDYVHLLGCDGESTEINNAIQKNYRKLFGRGKGGLIQLTEQLITDDQSLSRACNS